MVIESRLVCTALYNDGDAERKYLPQFFKFTVSNPLSVRTKVLSSPPIFIYIHRYLSHSSRTKVLADSAYGVGRINNLSSPFLFPGSHHQGRLPLVSQVQTITVSP